MTMTSFEPHTRDCARDIPVLLHGMCKLLVTTVFLAIPIWAQDSRPLFKNGAMTQGLEVPDEWRSKSGNGLITRDEQTFKSAPAALRVNSSEEKDTLVWQEFKGGAKGKFTVAGNLKTKGSPKAQVFVHAFAEGFKNNQFLQVVYVQGEHDWKEFSKEVTLPEWTAFYRVGLMVQGTGDAWLDDLREGAATKADEGKALTAAERLISGPPAKDKPDQPGWGFFPVAPQGWQSLHQNFLDRTKKGDIDIVFFGDSITMGWGNEGKEFWDKHFAPLKAVNYGIGGDTTRQILWRIEQGEIDGIKPKLVVLAIGTNNLYSDHNAGTDEEIFAGIKACVAQIQAKQPQATILLSAILPRQNEYFSNRIAKINALTAKLADGKKIQFLDLGTTFQTSVGKMVPTLFHEDQLHLAKPGYEAWGKALLPLVQEMSK
jgi:lysophospholipase L1-like esterase